MDERNAIDAQGFVVRLDAADAYGGRLALEADQHSRTNPEIFGDRGKDQGAGNRHVEELAVGGPRFATLTAAGGVGRDAPFENGIVQPIPLADAALPESNAQPFLFHIPLIGASLALLRSRAASV